MPGSAEGRRSPRAAWPARLGSGLLILVLLGLCACSTTSRKRREAIYDPVESITEVVAVLRRHIPDDTYRFPPGRDFTGRNVYRASLLRLENIERLHADELRSGYMDSVLLFAKARALERLRAYDLAARHYRDAARKDGELREEALRSAGVCEAIHVAVQKGIDFGDPTRTQDPLPRNPDRVTSQLDERISDLLAIDRGLETSHRPDSQYRYVIRQEIERADVLRAQYFIGVRYVIPDGTLRAISESQRLVTRHSASHLRRRHVLELADLYSEVAREYVDAVPPESLNFDPPRFQELVDAAVHLYQSVAAQDGTPEKIEAQRELEAFLAFTLRVDSDRFSP